MDSDQRMPHSILCEPHFPLYASSLFDNTLSCFDENKYVEIYCKYLHYPVWALFSVPGYISRSVAGSYDNEGIAIFALMFTYFLWVSCMILQKC